MTLYVLKHIVSDFYDDNFTECFEIIGVYDSIEKAFEAKVEASEKYNENMYGSYEVDVFFLNETQLF